MNFISRRRRGRFASLLALLVGTTQGPLALAQSQAQSPEQAPTPAPVMVPVPAAPPVPGTPAANRTAPAPFDPDAHLGSSSRSKSDINQGDSFDIGAGDSEGGGVLRGNADAPGILAEESQLNSGMHVVQAGDTLSKISAQAYGQPWMWPKLWAQNPQIQNPHWIYPGDQILLTGPATSSTPGSARTLGAGAPALRQALVPQESVFLRELGYIDDPSKGIVGEIIGGIEPVQLMSEGQNAYIAYKSDQNLRVGQILTIFRALRDPPTVEGARTPPGKLIALQGSIRLDYVNPEKHIARGEILESLDTIERGAKVGFVDDRLRIVPPKKSEKDVTARVLTSMYPHVIMGQNQIVFIDRGSIDGLVEGNRLFITRRGDTWRRTLSTTTVMARTRINMNAERLNFEPVPINGNEQDFPEEVVAELRVVKAHKFSALALVSSAKVEIQPGDRAIARTGF